MNSNAGENTQNHSQEENDQEVSGNDEEPPNKRQKIIQNQTKYNTDMVNEALIFFRLLLSNCLNWKIYCDDHTSLSSHTAVQI